MSEVELRKWAIEQALKAFPGCESTYNVLACANDILAFVVAKPAQASA
jgi:hypothetical protein